MLVTDPRRCRDVGQVSEQVVERSVLEHEDDPVVDLVHYRLAGSWPPWSMPRNLAVVRSPAHPIASRPTRATNENEPFFCNHGSLPTEVNIQQTYGSFPA